jgi:hypothetical protein
MTAAQTSAVMSIFEKVIKAIVSILYTTIDTILTVVTDPNVIAVIAAIGLFFLAYRWFRRRKIG